MLLLATACRPSRTAGAPLHRGNLSRRKQYQIFLVIMEPRHSAEMSKHLDKQNHAQMETYRAMSHELHKLQVEEETIMHKLYELMSAEGLLPKRKKERQLEEAGNQLRKAESEERIP